MGMRQTKEICTAAVSIGLIGWRVSPLHVDHISD